MPKIDPRQIRENANKKKQQTTAVTGDIVDSAATLEPKDDEASNADTDSEASSD